MTEEMPAKVGRPRNGSNYIPLPKRSVVKVPMEGPFAPGRPKVTENRIVREKRPKAGRPQGSSERAAGGTYSLGHDYIERLNALSDQLQMTKSAIIRDCINRLATRFGFEQASFDHEEQGYRPSQGSSGINAYFRLGDNHRDLLERMRKIRDDANDGKPAGRRRMGGATELLREELDRFAVEHGYEPLQPLTDQVIAV